MKKKFCTALLAAALALPGALPVAALPVFVAPETELAALSETPVFEQLSMTEMASGDHAVELSAEQIAQISALESMTFETEAELAGAGDVNSIFSLSKASEYSYYSSIYINLSNNKFGVEGRTGATYQYNLTADLPEDFDETQSHKYAVSFSAGNEAVFYLDGTEIGRSAVTTSYLKDVFQGFTKGALGKTFRNAPNMYPFSGKIWNTRIFGSVRTADQIIADQAGIEESLVYSADPVFQTQNPPAAVTDTETINTLKALSEGSWRVRFRMDGTKTDDLSYLAGFSDQNADRDFAGLYLMKREDGWKAGIDAPDKNIAAEVAVDEGTDVTDGAWHDLMAVRTGTTWTFYMDGTQIGEPVTTASDGFFNKLSNPNALTVGYTRKATESFYRNLGGSVYKAEIYSSAISSADAAMLSADLAHSTEMKVDLSNAYLGQRKFVYDVGDGESKAYRIPSLINTDKNTLLAFSDKRNDGSKDSGNIDLVVRRKVDGSDRFGEPIVITDLLNTGTNRVLNPVVIDAVSMQDTADDSPYKGRIHVLVDMFTESKANENQGILQPGDQYIHIGEDAYRAVYKDGENQPYAVVVRDGTGFVYTTKEENGSTVLGEQTDYTVTIECPAPYKQLGNLYNGGEYKGNIFLSEPGPDRGELHMNKAMFLWHFYSDDDGLTWSQPHDITPMVKPDWALFFGTGPGNGIQLDSGRIVFPCYSMNNTHRGSSEASSILVSDDYGETWTYKDAPLKSDPNGFDPATGSGATGIECTESQAVQIANGDLLLFMRNESGRVKLTRSTDEGETWSPIEQTPVRDNYCMLSAINYIGKDGKEYIIISNPEDPASGRSRRDGRLTRALVNADGSLTWQMDLQKQIEPEGYAYSSLTEIKPAADGTKRFADLYELNNEQITLAYIEFDENYLSAPKKSVDEAVPAFASVSADRSTAGKLTVTAQADCSLFLAGNVSLKLRLGESGIVELPLKTITNGKTRLLQ